MPFSDPMADGPAIEKANLRAFAVGINLTKIIRAVREFRTIDQDTSIILMGNANPLYAYGLEAFAFIQKKPALMDLSLPICLLKKIGICVMSQKNLIS